MQEECRGGLQSCSIARGNSSPPPRKDISAPPARLEGLPYFFHARLRCVRPVICSCGDASPTESLAPTPRHTPVTQLSHNDSVESCKSPGTRQPQSPKAPGARETVRLLVCLNIQGYIALVFTSTAISRNHPSSVLSPITNSPPRLLESAQGAFSKPRDADKSTVRRCLPSASSLRCSCANTVAGPENAGTNKQCALSP